MHEKIFFRAANAEIESDSLPSFPSFAIQWSKTITIIDLAADNATPIRQYEKLYHLSIRKNLICNLSLKANK